MELDYQKVYHNFITRLVIFSVFLHKDLRRQENVYNQAVISFIRKRIPHDIELYLEVGPKMTKNEEREIAIDMLLDNNTEVGILNMVFIRFKTGLMEVKLQIDLEKEEKYENFLYN
jgi:hypothetical protein